MPRLRQVTSPVDSPLLELLGVAGDITGEIVQKEEPGVSESKLVLESLIGICFLDAARFIRICFLDAPRFNCSCGLRP